MRFDRIAPGGFRILGALQRVAEICQLELTITSAADSHPADDPHSRGEAYDVRVRGLSEQQIFRLYYWLQAELGGKFTVLFETPVLPTPDGPWKNLGLIAYVNPGATGPHLHVQVAKGQTFP